MPHFKSKLISLLIPLLLLSGCVSYYSPVPEGYTEPVSRIGSTEHSHSSSKADLFYLDKVDAKAIYSAHIATIEATSGQGSTLLTRTVNTAVPSSKEGVFSIVGRTVFAAPVQALVGTVYEIKGDITFTPKRSTSYLVKGELGKAYSAVWIESKATGEVVGEKIEIFGDAALPFWQK